MCRNSPDKEGSDAGLGYAPAAAAGAVAGGVGAVAAVPAVAAGMGFSSGGIVAGSMAAGIMSAEAVAAGGGVAAGGFTATMQSIGATGTVAALPVEAAMGIAAGGALIGMALGGGVYHFAIAPNMRPLSHQPEHRAGVKRGRWMVLMEEGWGNVAFYPFASEDEARGFLAMVRRDRPSRPRVLFDPAAREVAAEGWNSLALGTIRGACAGTVEWCGRNSRDAGAGFFGLAPGATVALFCPAHGRFLRALAGEAADGESHEGGGQWVVATEEGVGNVRLYAFGGEGGARSYFGAWQREPLARVLYRPCGQEEACGGWNGPALGTIRRVVGGWRPWEASGGVLSVVDAGGGEVGLYSKAAGRFLRLDGPRVDFGGGEGGAVSAEERFGVVDAGGGLVALHCAASNRFVRIDPGGGVNARGGVRDADSLPDCWYSERFEVRAVGGE